MKNLQCIVIFAVMTFSFATAQTRAAFEIKPYFDAEPKRFFMISCQMGECVWSALQRRVIVAASEKGSLVGVSTLSCAIKQGKKVLQPVCSIHGTSQEQAAAFCSPKNPSVAIKNNKGLWEKTKLSISDSGAFGYNREAMSRYLWICHDFILAANDPVSLDVIGAKFGYIDRYNAIGDDETGTLTSINELID